MLPSITKKGEIESTVAPLEVLVINDNIPCGWTNALSSMFQEVQSSRNGKGDGEVESPKAKASIGKSSRLHFWFSDPRSHRVHRKANTIKRG